MPDENMKFDEIAVTGSVQGQSLPSGGPRWPNCKAVARRTALALFSSVFLVATAAQAAEDDALKILEGDVRLHGEPKDHRVVL